MKLKHFSGYGSVIAKKVKDSTCTLHIQVVGNHEYGICRNDEYDLFNWLIRRFDKLQTDYLSWHSKKPKIKIIESNQNGIDVCDYLFVY